MFGGTATGEHFSAERVTWSPHVTMLRRDLCVPVDAAIMTMTEYMEHSASHDVSASEISQLGNFAR